MKGPHLLGICNGISYDNYSLCSPKIFHQSCLQPDFGAAELSHNRAFMKGILARNGLIANEEAPLLLYVGRFSAEKGIARFDQAVEVWTKAGGQVVLMGIVGPDKYSQEVMSTLQEKYALYSRVRIYTDLAEDQLAKLGVTGIRKGHMLRGAADWALIPSKVEACGLVAMELLSTGTPIITSWVQGLKDMCLPLGIYHPLLQREIDIYEWNSLSYWEQEGEVKKTEADLADTLNIAYNLQMQASSYYWECCVRAVKTSIQYDWHADDGPMQQYETVYTHLNAQIFPMEEPEDFIGQLERRGLDYPERQLFYRHNPFILSSVIKAEDLLREDKNYPDLEQTQITKFKEGRVVLNTLPVDTLELEQQSRPYYRTWILDEKGNFYTGAFCHAYYLKGASGKPFYGIGRPIACGGDVIMTQGKITYLDNRTGHYKCGLDQFLLAIHYLDSKGVLDEKVMIRNELTGQVIPQSVLRDIEPLRIMQNYVPLSHHLEGLGNSTDEEALDTFGSSGGN